MQRVAAWLRGNAWVVAFGAAAVLLAGLHLGALGTSPPGLYNDEASIGYNAWAIAHHGVDEHGVSFPLYFEAFGEYKGPISIYLLAPFTWVLPLTPYVERLPSALCGLLIAVFAGLTAYRLFGSRPVALLALLTAGLEPWLFLDSRTDLEAIVPMTLGFVVALWCLAHVEPGDTWRWFFGAGTALGVALFAYTPARVFVAVTAVIIAVAYRFPAGRYRNWWAVLPPVIAAYVVYLQWTLRHSGALNGRFGALSISADNPGLLTLAGRFLGNYVQYMGVPFLFSHGDANPRHNTGFGGMLFIVSLPVLVAGLVACVRRLDQALPRVALMGLVTAPVPAALTEDGTPHSLRSVLMMPFVLLIISYGWDAAWPWLLQRRAWAIALAVVASLEVSGYTYDLFVEYPGRTVVAYRSDCACTWFDSGIGDAIVRAHDSASGHTVLLSNSLDTPYIQALFRLRPDPADYARRGLNVLDMEALGAVDIPQRVKPGDLMVLDPHDTVPSGSTHLFDESVTVARHTAEVGQADSFTVVLASVYRR
jgi:hypothetical protein